MSDELKPRTRKEQYYEYMATGENAAELKPRSREEQWFEKIAESGGTDIGAIAVTESDNQLVIALQDSEGQTIVESTPVGVQEALVSGENVKTINDESILGEGNIEVLTSKGVAEGEESLAILKGAATTGKYATSSGYNMNTDYPFSIYLTGSDLTYTSNNSYNALAEGKVNDYILYNNILAKITDFIYDSSNETYTLTLDTTLGELNSALVKIVRPVSGDYAFSEGLFNEASGECSHAEGSRTIASGSCAHAEGSRTIASDSDTHAEGSGTQAFDFCAHAEGCATQAGSYAHAEGNKTIASANYSHAEGNCTCATHRCAHVEGGDYTWNDAREVTTLENDLNQVMTSNSSYGIGDEFILDNDLRARDWSKIYIVTNVIESATYDSTYRVLRKKYTVTFNRSFAQGNTLYYIYPVHRSNGGSAHVEGYMNNAYGTCAHVGGQHNRANYPSQTVFGEYSDANAAADIPTRLSWQAAITNYHSAPITVNLYNSDKTILKASLNMYMNNELTIQRYDSYSFDENVFVYPTDILDTPNGMTDLSNITVQDFIDLTASGPYISSWGWFAFREVHLNIPTQHGKYVEVVGNGTTAQRSNARTLTWSGDEHIAGNMTVNHTTLINNSNSDIDINLPSSSGTLALTNQIPVLPSGSAIIALDSSDIITIKAGLVETDGIIANSSDSDITLAKVAKTGAYADLSGTPTDVSAFNNDAGYISSLPSGSAVIASESNSIITLKAGLVETDGVIANSSDSDITLAKVASTGAYNDLSGKPSIPTVADYTEYCTTGNFIDDSNNYGSSDCVLRFDRYGDMVHLTGRFTSAGMTTGTTYQLVYYYSGWTADFPKHDSSNAINLLAYWDSQPISDTDYKGEIYNFTSTTPVGHIFNDHNNFYVQPLTSITSGSLVYFSLTYKCKGNN